MFQSVEHLKTERKSQMMHRIISVISILFFTVGTPAKVVIVSSKTVLQETIQGQQLLKNIDSFENKILKKLDEQKANVAASEQEVENLDLEFTHQQQEAVKSGSGNNKTVQKNIKFKKQALKQLHIELKKLQKDFKKKTEDVKPYIDGYYQIATKSFFYINLKRYAYKFWWDIILEKETCEYSATSLDVTSKILQELHLEVPLRSKKYATDLQIRELFDSLGLVYLQVNMYAQSLLPIIEQQEKEYGVKHQKTMDAYLEKYGAQIEQKYRAPFYIAWVDDAVGWGVFAAKDIAQGDFIQEYIGEISATTPIQDTAYAWHFLEGIGSHQLVNDGLLKGNEMRFVNHSNHPNLACVTMFGKDKHYHLCYVAIANIKAGEQLCVSYGALYWNMRPYREEMVD